MKYTFTFETSEAGNVPKKKINNFLKQVIDGINGIDEKSPNKDDYSITENIEDETIDLYFNMDTKSNLLKHMMSGIFDAFITASGIKRNTVFDDVIDIHTIADTEEQWTPTEYANYVLKTFTNYNVPRFIKNESVGDFNISFDVSLKHEIYQNIKSIMRSMEDHLMQSEPICSLWVHDRGNHSLSVSINQDKLSEHGLKYISDTVFPVMRYLFGEDVDLSDISPNNVEPVELVEKIYDEDDNNEEPDKKDSDTFHVGNKSLVRHIEKFITELRPEPVNKENIDQIAMVYSNIDNDKDSYYRIIRILHYVLIGYTCIDNVREKSAYDYANGNISIDYIDNIPTVKLNGSCCKLDTLEVFKAMNEFLRMFAVYYSSNNILDKFDELIDAGRYVQLYREFMQLYRTGIKRIAYSIDETTEFESWYSRMLSNLLYITAYPEYRERIKNDLVPIKSLHVLETILVIQQGFKIIPVVAKDQIIFTLFNKNNKDDTDALSIRFTREHIVVNHALDKESGVYDITGDNACPIYKPFEIIIERLSSKEHIASIIISSDEISKDSRIPAFVSVSGISHNEKKFAASLYHYLVYIHFRKLENGKAFNDESMLTI